MGGNIQPSFQSSSSPSISVADSSSIPSGHGLALVQGDTKRMDTVNRSSSMYRQSIAQQGMIQGLKPVASPGSPPQFNLEDSISGDQPSRFSSQENKKTGELATKSSITDVQQEQHSESAVTEIAEQTGEGSKLTEQALARLAKTTGYNKVENYLGEQNEMPPPEKVESNNQQLRARGRSSTNSVSSTQIAKYYENERGNERTAEQRNHAAEHKLRQAVEYFTTATYNQQAMYELAAAEACVESKDLMDKAKALRESNDETQRWIDDVDPAIFDAFNAARKKT